MKNSPGQDKLIKTVVSFLGCMKSEQVPGSNPTDLVAEECFA